MKMKLKNYNWEKLSLELVAVFLGVTAGFVLNNWQVEHQERRLEQKYISGFQQDVAYNNSELENALQADSLWLARTKPLILLVKEKTLPIDSAHVIMRLLSNISRIEYNTGTYSDITNSGNLNLITDFELKDQIVDYQIAINGVNFIDDYFYQYFSDFVMPLIFREYNILNGEFGDLTVIKSNSFSNVFAGYYSMIQQRQAAYKSLLVKSKSLEAKLNASITAPT